MTTDREFTDKEILYIVYFMVIFVVGVTCHVLIFLAFILNPSVRRSVSNLIFASIAVADSCTICWTVPLSLVSRFKGRWPWNFTDNQDTGPTCQFSGVLDNSVAVCSVWTLGLYALDRLIYVMYPLKYHTKMNRKKALAMLLCIWVYSVSLSLPPVFGYNSYRFSKNSFTCGISEMTHSYFLMFFLGAFPLPLLTICVSYILIYTIARENSRRVSSLCDTLYEGSENLMNKAKSHIKSTAVVSAVISCSLICLLPIFITAICFNIAHPTKEQFQENIAMWDALNQIGTVLFFLNCNAGTIIFISCNKQLRQAIRGIIRCETQRSSEIKKLHKQQSTIKIKSEMKSRTLSGTRSPLTGSAVSTNLPYIAAAMRE